MRRLLVVININDVQQGVLYCVRIF